ncbi:MAG: hypothetical protein LAT64_09605 [Phycisphaerales bacterium]|nr:hypothetical protein [Planctomycetota bacterium]MCH8509003.1 hypothetical protein [Phycisphaerales bacterium]
MNKKTKRSSKLDAIAAALLIGTVGTMALSQVSGPPSPVQHWCPGGSVTIGAQTVTYTGNFCPIGTDCGVEIIYNHATGQFTARVICITAQ